MNKKKFILISFLALIASLLYMVVWLYTYKDQIIGNFSDPYIKNAIIKIFVERSYKLLAILISAILIATSSLIFQTITNNRILTPSVLGFDSIYVVTQTLLIVILGAASSLVTNENYNFIISIAAMIFVTLLMYSLILKKNKNNIILLLLVGMIISQLSRSISSFIQIYMKPDDFQSVMALTNVNLNNISINLITISIPIMIIIFILMLKNNKYYDVMALGEDVAINLGVNYQKKVKLSLIYIAIAVAISTALIGPLTFLGLIAVNGAREIFKTNKHFNLIFASSLMAIIFIMFGQVIVELLNHTTTVSILINLVGGSYMIYLILRENKI